MKKINLLLLGFLMTFVNAQQNDCSYYTNEIDEFTGKKVIKTKFSSLNSYKSKKPLIEIMLRNINNKKSIIFATNKDLGCAIPYKKNRSFVKVKLVNDEIVSFFHGGNVDCGDFTVIARLTENDIKKLKQSPIKTIRFSGKKSYYDAKEVDRPNFFIENLGCIN